MLDITAQKNLPGRFPYIGPIHFKVEKCLNGVVRRETVQVDVNQLLHEDAGVGVHDQAGAGRRVARHPRGIRALILKIAPGRGRGQLDTVTLEVTFVQS